MWKMIVTCVCFALLVSFTLRAIALEVATDEFVPEYLYKVVSTEAWQSSQSEEFLRLSDDDSKFIHFSEEVHVPRILAKYWSHEAEVYVLQVKVNKLSGRLVKEKNPGGVTSYFHLYNGNIPISAVVDARLVNP